MTCIVDRSTEEEVIFPAGDSQLPKAVHTISVRDLVTSSTVLEYFFAIFPGVRLSLNKNAYIDAESSAVLTVTDGSSKIELPAIRIEGSDIAETTATYCGLMFVAELPVIHANIGETSLFDLPAMLWYESIEKSDYVRLSLPDGWKGYLMLGVDCIEPNADGNIELGNYLHSVRNFESHQRLWLSLHSNQGALTVICGWIRNGAQPILQKPFKGVWGDFHIKRKVAPSRLACCCSITSLDSF